MPSTERHTTTLTCSPSPVNCPWYSHHLLKLDMSLRNAWNKTRRIVWGEIPQSKEERRLLLKIDWFILSYCCLMVCPCHIYELLHASNSPSISRTVRRIISVTKISARLQLFAHRPRQVKYIECICLWDERRITHGRKPI